MVGPSRVVVSEAVDWYICFTRKIQHGGDWEQSCHQYPNYVHNFLMTVRAVNWACGHVTEMLLFLKKTVQRQSVAEICFSHWDLVVAWFYLWLKPVSATGT